MEEEDEAVEKETRKIVEQISNLLEQFELKEDFEHEMMNKAEQIIKSKVKKEKVKESTRRVITIKENPEQEYAPKERRKSKSSGKLS